MNPEMIKGKWNQLKGDIKMKWGKLTDNDLTQAEGSAEKLVGLLQEKYGYSKDQAEREVNTFMQSHS